jgi:hypothetical protein
MSDDTDFTDTDITENDTQFGRAAQEKQERADELLAEGRNPVDEPEGAGADPRPRAGGKASQGAPAAADADQGGVDEDSEESFPASDPPANY